MKGDDLILSFDTATNNCSIAITNGDFGQGRVLGSLSLNSGVTHSRRLLTAVEWLMQNLELALVDIAAVAVGLGPGSFTGLRIGMATAKGLCHGSSKPLVGVSSLDAIAVGVYSEKLICVVMDARKKEVYSCFYRCNTGKVARRCSQPVVLPPQELAEQISEPVIMAGDGIDVYNAVLADVLGDRLETATPLHRFPEATNIGFLAATEHADENYLDLDQAKPDYVRSSDAQLSLVSPIAKGKTKNQ